MSGMSRRTTLNCLRATVILPSSVSQSVNSRGLASAVRFEGCLFKRLLRLQFNNIALARNSPPWFVPLLLFGPDSCNVQGKLHGTPPTIRIDDFQSRERGRRDVGGLRYHFEIRDPADY